MVHNIVQSSKPEMPWITRHAINRAFSNFERDRKLNTISQSYERTPSIVANHSPSMREAVAYMLTDILTSPEYSPEASPEPSINYSNRPKRGYSKHMTNE